MNVLLCACGCGKEIDISKSRGEPKRFFSSACKQRFYRQNKRNGKRNAPLQPLQAPLKVKAILKYPGAKWKLASWIVSFFPAAYEHYIEPYCGSAAVFFTKQKSQHEVLNDLNHSIVNLFTVMQTRGDELARAIMLSPWSEYEYNAIERHIDDTDDELEHARR